MDDRNLKFVIQTQYNISFYCVDFMNLYSLLCTSLAKLFDKGDWFLLHEKSNLR